MSRKDKGLWKITVNFIMKWDEGRLWYTTPGHKVFKEVWELKGIEGWEGKNELEGAALVAPLSILFWEKE